MASFKQKPKTISGFLLFVVGGIFIAIAIHTLPQSLWKELLSHFDLQSAIGLAFSFFGTIFTAYAIFQNYETSTDNQKQQLEERINKNVSDLFIRVDKIEERLSDRICKNEESIELFRGMINEVIIAQQSHEKQPGHGKLLDQVFDLAGEIKTQEAELKALMYLIKKFVDNNPELFPIHTVIKQ